MRTFLLVVVALALVASVAAVDKKHGKHHHKAHAKHKAKINPFGADQLSALRDARLKRKQWRADNGFPEARIIEGGYELALFMDETKGPGWTRPIWDQMAYDIVDLETEPLAFAVTSYLCHDANNTDSCVKALGQDWETKVPAVAMSVDAGETFEVFQGNHDAAALGSWINEKDGDELPVVTSSTPDKTAKGVCTPFPPGGNRKPECLEAMKSCWRRWKFGKIKCMCNINAMCGTACPFNQCPQEEGGPNTIGGLPRVIG